MRKALINLLNAWAEKVRGCQHDWELESKITLTGDGWGGYRDTVTGHKWIYRCTKCGEFTKVKS